MCIQCWLADTAFEDVRITDPVTFLSLTNHLIKTSDSRGME